MDAAVGSRVLVEVEEASLEEVSEASLCFWWWWPEA
jgi:hypothetical protein